MACKIVRGDGFIGFQCTTSPLGGPHLPDDIGEEGRNLLNPYDERECAHENRFDRNGLLTCLDCAMVYDERTLTWVLPAGDD
jgi:hypothetical protein